MYYLVSLQIQFTMGRRQEELEAAMIDLGESVPQVEALLKDFEALEEESQVSREREGEGGRERGEVGERGRERRKGERRGRQRGEEGERERGEEGERGG